MMTVAVVGGGNSAHTLIPLLSSTGMKINLLTRKPKKWSKEIELDYIHPTGKYVRSFKGKLNKISDKPADIIPEADFIILCLPVHIYRKSLHSIAPYITKEKDVFVGTVYGQGGFNWMTNEIKAEFNLDNIKTFAIGLIPWICRTKTYGRKGIVYGAKPINIAAVEPSSAFAYLNEKLLEKITYYWFGHGRFIQADNFLSLTLSVDNQILHTARMFGLSLEHGGGWDNTDSIPFFYSEYSELSAGLLKGLDTDYSHIKNRVKEQFPKKRFPYMMSYIEQDNMTNLKNNKTYLETFRNSNILVRIKPPVVKRKDKWVLDRGHRFLVDDVLYGLCIAKSIAQMLKIDTFHIDKTLAWAQETMGENIISNHKLVINEELRINKFKFGVPEVYGLESIEDICS